jgi:hypothetical protein
MTDRADLAECDGCGALYTGRPVFCLDWRESLAAECG